MQRAYDCDMVLVHDDDLERVNGIGSNTVSGHFVIYYVVLPMLAVTRISRIRSGYGSPPEVQHRSS
jgi:hypothetical protein